MRLDSIVVGGGLCGTLAAQHLISGGQSVLLLETGPATKRALPSDVRGFQRTTEPLTTVDPGRWAFDGPKGYEWHRVRALGGRTLLWGGWMLQPTPDYFAARRALEAGWPHELENLGHWVRLAKQRLHVKSGPRGVLHKQLAALGINASVKQEAVKPGSLRMLTALDLRPRQVRRATVLSFKTDERGVQVHLEGDRTVEARRLVLAASPLETARIIAASRKLDRSTTISYADHLIAGVMVISERHAQPERKLGGAEPSAVILPSRHAEYRFTTEIRGPTPLEQLGASDLAALGFSRADARRHSFYVVFAMGETDPHRLRECVFDPRARDGLGRPRPKFVKRRHTRWERELGRAMNEECLRIGSALAAGSGRCFPIADALEYASGGHETGTCMPDVMPDGSLRDAPHVFVADGSGVPAATDRHPSLLLAANALRVAESALSGARS